MERRLVPKRDNWRQKFDELGFSFHSMGGAYWNEGVCYQFTSEEIDLLEEATADLHALCLQAVDYVIDRNLFDRLGIPERCAEFAVESWRRGERSLYGRLDFSYDGAGEPKLLEYNADTPTSLVESSIAQWVWLEEMYPDYDQFNSIHEKLLDAFAAVKAEQPFLRLFHFTSVREHEEDFVTVEYLRDVAVQSGLDGRHIFIEDIGWNSGLQCFCDLDNNPISHIFKLYPWEWLLADDFGANVIGCRTQFFEPAWKMILTGKGILPVLWEMAPGHKNLLPAFLEEGRIAGDVVRKPLFSREGANIVLQIGGKTYQGADANYGSEGFMFQQACPLPDFDGNHAVVGSWVVNGLPAGIDVREDSTPITTNTSLFVPHFFQP